MRIPGSVFDLASEITSLQQQDLFRVCKEINSPQGPVVNIDGDRILNFCSNDYLGLANDDRLIACLGTSAKHYGVGSGASQLVCGRNSAHVELESALAKITNRDRALVFSSGYLANLSTITALCPGRHDAIIEDRMNHASMIDGALLSRATFKRYRHADPASLEQVLGALSQKKKLVLTDGVFSMDGDIAPVSKLASVCAKANACLVVDDAHGFGVLGKNGGGTLEHLSLTQADVPVLMATFGKALGVFGAFVAGPDDVIELLVQRARPYIYTTALPPAIAATVLKSLNLMREEGWRREKLQLLIKYYKKGAALRGLEVQASDTPIQPLIVGSASNAKALSEKLFQAGILVAAIRPPTVPKNTSRLRITLTAVHTEAQLDQLLDALALCLTSTKTQSAC